MPSKNLSKFAFASQYFDEECFWKGQGLGKYEHGLVEPIIIEPCLPLDKCILGYQNQTLVISAPHIISCEKEIPK